MGKRTRKLLGSKIEIARVNRDVIVRWIADQMNTYLPDDDIVADYLVEMLYADEDGNPNGIEICSLLVDFLGDEAATVFCGELWALLESAQHDADGIPAQLIKARKHDEPSTQPLQNIESTPHQLPVRPKTNYNRVILTTDAGHTGDARTDGSARAQRQDAYTDRNLRDRSRKEERRRSRSPRRNQIPRDHDRRDIGSAPHTLSGAFSRSPSRSPSRERN